MAHTPMIGLSRPGRFGPEYSLMVVLRFKQGELATELQAAIRIVSQSFPKDPIGTNSFESFTSGDQDCPVSGVVRCSKDQDSPAGESPTAYHVFGPNLVGTCGFFEDRALESRFLTEEMGQFRLRDDVPINLDAGHKEETLRIRNKLLMFRFRNLRRRHPSEELVDRTTKPRLNQVFVPLLSIIEDAQAREDLKELDRTYNREMISEHGMDTEAQVLEVIRDMLSAPYETRISVKDIASWFLDRHQNEYKITITPRWVGRIVRKNLDLKTHRTGGGYVIPETEHPKLARLYEKYGISPTDK